MIDFSCGRCLKRLKARDEAAGKNVKCPGCGQTVRVPEAVASSPAPEGKTLGRADAGPGVEKTLPPPRAGSVPAAPGAGTGATLRPGNAPAQGGPESGGSRADTLGGEHQGEGSELTDFLAPAQAPDEIGRLGPYRVLQVLGAGGMGVVYKAEDPQLQRLVALKVMLPTLAAGASARQRFFREAKAAAALKHPNIVTIFQVGEDRGTPFLAMEFLEGEALEERLQREVKLPVPEVLRIGRDIAEGLDAAHERGLIHRDIKPANVWLEGKKAHVKILDFGLARAMGDQTHLTQSGLIVGTPAYMAPEQACARQVDHRCDLFSLGCLLYRLCTGRMPFHGSDTISILAALALETPPPPRSVDPEVPAELSDLVMQLLSKKPEERPQTARAVIEALGAVEQERGTADKPGRGMKRSPAVKAGEGKPQRVRAAAPARRNRRRWLGLAGAAAILALLAGGIVLVRPTPVPVTTADGKPPPDPSFGQRQPKLLHQIQAFVNASNVAGAHVGISKDGNFLVATGSQREPPASVRVYDPKAGKELATMPDTNGFSWRGEFSPEGNLLAATGNKELRLWEWPSKKPLETIPLNAWGEPQALAFSPDGRWLVWNDHPEDDKNAAVLHWRDRQKPEAKIPPTAVGMYNVNHAVFSADSRYLAAGPHAGRLKVFDVNTRQVLFEKDTGNRADSVSFSRLGKMVAASGQPDTTFVVFSVPDGKELVNLTMSTRGLVGPFLDEDRLATWTGADGTVSFIDTTTWKVTRAFKAHDAPIQGVAVSPDGTLLATLDKDGVLKIWE